MAKKISGGCACGAIHYECDVDAVVMMNCHCRDCQKANGAAYAAIMALPRAAFQIRGTPSYHGIVGASGKLVERGFCPSCGSQLTFKAEVLSSAFRQEAWTTHQFIARTWTYSPQARNPGITWIPPSKSIRMLRRSDPRAFRQIAVRATPVPPARPWPLSGRACRSPR